MKNVKIIIPLVIFSLIVGATVVKSQLDKKEYEEKANAALEVAQANKVMQSTMHEEYPGVPETNHFIRESADEIVDRFDSGTGVIFLGFKECPWCQKTAPLINDAAEAEGIPIYYLDIRLERENMTAPFQEIMSILSPYLPKNEAGAPTISTPDISFVRNGEIVWRFELDATTEAERTPATYWTDERQERAIEKFKDEMQNLK